MVISFRFVEALSERPVRAADNLLKKNPEQFRSEAR